MVFRIDRAEEVLHDVRGDIYGELVFMRVGPQPGGARDFPDFAGPRGRRVATEGASDSERYISAGEARHGVCRLRAGRGGGTNHWTVAGRMDHGQFFLEMDLL